MAESCQSAPACPCDRRSSLSNNTLFGEPGWFCVHGSQHCGSQGGATGRGERGLAILPASHEAVADLTAEQEVLVSDRVRQFRSFLGELGIALLN